MALRNPFAKAKGRAPQGARDISDLIQAMTQVNRGLQERNEALRQLPLDPRWAEAEFGPNYPLASQALDAPNAQGFATPRIHQYPVGINLQLTREHMPWATLKAAADQPLARACIEIRKNRISTLDWCFRVRPSYAARMARKSGENEYEVENDLRNQFQDEIDRLTSFWEVPDRRNGYEFADWMGMIQEEQLTWDALAVYPQKTFGGNLLNLTVIDGSTVKPLLDEQGGRPMPPLPAFQQILYGFPRGDFTADTVNIDGELVVPGAFSSSQLIYRRRVVRTWTPYGFSPTEQALLDSALWDKRFRWMMAEYTEGAQPVQWLINKGGVDWDARQLLGYEKYLNDRLGGKTGERFRNPLLPEGIEPVRNEQAPERYSPEYDLFLIKLQAMHYGVTMPELGFSEPGGLGSTGYHEGEEDIQFRKDLTTVRWLNDFVSGISRTHLGMSDAIEFSFLGLDEEDEGVADAIDDSRLRGARMTINETRGRLGLPPMEFQEADMLMLMTQRGVVFLDGAADAAPPGVLIEPAELNGEIQPEDLEDGDGQDSGEPSKPKTAKVQGSPKPARPVKKSPTAAEAAKGVESLSRGVMNPAMAKELAQFAKCLAKDPNAWETFEFRHANGEMVKAAIGAGGAGPKASSPPSSPDGLTPIQPSVYSRPSS